jgi:hypothetical protein
MQKNESSTISAKEIVTEFIEALERKDWKTVRSYISDNISFMGPTSFDRAEPYLKFLEHLDLPKSEIKKVIADGQDICLLNELNFGTPPITLFVCKWFHVNVDSKINSIRVVFDPRPFVQR